MSLGGGIYTSACDSDPLKPVIDELRGQRIATVIASGNSSSNSGVGTPGCISSAVTVGATTDFDTEAVTSFSNSSPLVDLLAPGQWINSSVPTDAFASYQGTSMAAPHVAGAFAALQSKVQNKTIAQIEQALSATGKPITDPDNGLTRPRIDLAAALAALGVSPAPSWRPWESFEGSLTSNPECLSSSATQTDCWATLSSGLMGWWRYSGSAAPTLVSFPGQVGSPPSCLYAGGKLHCFARLSSSQLGQITYTGSAWGSWQSLGDNIRRRPACVSPDGTKIICVAINASNKLRTRAWSGTSWGAWTALATAVTTSEPPTCYARAGGIDCVVADTGKRLQFLRRNSAGTWAAPTNLKGTVMGVASCIAPSATTRSCFIQGTDSTLRLIYFNGTKWGSWQNLGGVLKSAPSCVWFNNAEVQCFATTSSGNLQQKRKVGNSWQAWVNLGGSLAASRPDCVAPTGARLDCFARGSTNALAHTAYY